MQGATTKNRKLRQNVSAFRSLIATPAATTVQLPASGMFAVMNPAGASNGATALTVAGGQSHTIKVPALAAGEFRLIGKLERSTEVVMTAGFDLYLDTGLGKLRKVVDG
jgi:hypothetical protein